MIMIFFVSSDVVVIMEMGVSVIVLMRFLVLLVIHTFILQKIKFEFWFAFQLPINLSFH